jgi:hypothetical protein
VGAVLLLLILLLGCLAKPSLSATHTSAVRAGDAPRPRAGAGPLVLTAGSGTADTRTAAELVATNTALVGTKEGERCVEHFYFYFYFYIIKSILLLLFSIAIYKRCS